MGSPKPFFSLARKRPWEGEDGVQVEGLLFWPLDYEEGRRYPLIVQTHGGPASSDKFQFGGSSDYIQILTDKGYFVFAQLPG